MEPVGKSKRIAQIVAISGYRHAPHLRNPINDGASLRLALERIGFDEVRTAVDCDLSELREILQRNEKELAVHPHDIFLFYFAGHGIEIDGESYIIPSDADLSSAEDADGSCVPLTRLKKLGASARRVGVLILDACRNNPFRERMIQTQRDYRKRPRSVGIGLGRVEAVPNTAVAYAAKEGTTALDGEGDNSPFNIALTRYIVSPGLDIRIMFGRVRDAVVESTAGKQVPHLYVSLGGEEVSIHSGLEVANFEEANRLFEIAIRHELDNRSRKDLREAARAYRKALELGHVRAMTKLAHLYMSGQGVPRDEVEAFTLYSRAATKGDAVAMLNCGICYLQGRGVLADRIRAIEWLRKSATLGTVDAMLKLRQLGQDL